MDFSQIGFTCHVPVRKRGMLYWTAEIQSGSYIGSLKASVTQVWWIQSWAGMVHSQKNLIKCQTEVIFRWTPISFQIQVKVHIHCSEQMGTSNSFWGQWNSPPNTLTKTKRNFFTSTEKKKLFAPVQGENYFLWTLYFTGYIPCNHKHFLHISRDRPMVEACLVYRYMYVWEFRKVCNVTKYLLTWRQCYWTTGWIPLDGCILQCSFTLQPLYLKVIPLYQCM